MSSQAAGWYDDPEDPAQQRYWDGTAWTDHRRPQPSPQSPPPFRPAQHGQVYGSQPPVQPQPEPRYGQRLPQYQQYPQQPQYGQYAGQQPQYGQYGPQHPQQGYGYAGHGAKVAPDGQPLSGWWRRVFAKILDSIIASVIGLPLTGYFYYQYGHALSGYFHEVMRAAESGRPASPMAFPPELLKWMVPITLIGFVVSFLYEYLFLTKKGATPGKMALGIAVRHIPVPGRFVSTPPPGSAVAKRYGFQLGLSALGLVPIVGTLAGFAALLDYLWPLWDSRHQALHDKVADTYVVRV
ncbi:hypothetical protein GCM10009630_47480 [Kribbella jejuensis]|uniref:Putative RDD family membrane protein YckC n=1 Tax=Kribbella jejuensis TaxID=236068 RepID=A0A542E798_9ACTN|nr:RDD family protein [Kribbella jejuensis]TQJ11136.1 putative RDD family membrane protein YckC [Kribbella jejuensis]